MDFEKVIRQYVPLATRPSGKGWYGVMCRVCNDHGKKGTRGGFHFQDGIGYNCFNCEHTAGYTNGQPFTPDDALKVVFDAYGIPDAHWNELVMESLQNRNSDNGAFHAKIVKASTIEAKVLQQPDYFHELSSLPEDMPLRQLAELHLIEERGIDPAAYPFLVALKDDEDPYSAAWLKRLIIPVYDRANRLIFYQGRDLIGTANNKYKSPSVDRDCVLYGMDQIYKHTNAPLFVVEGFFDAFHVDGVAILGRQLTDPMVQHLNNSVREKIIIPDRTGNGEDLALAGLKQGWKVSTPDFGNCKDITEAVVKYGKLYVMKSITDNVHSGFSAELNVRMYCKK